MLQTYKEFATHIISINFDYWTPLKHRKLSSQSWAWLKKKVKTQPLLRWWKSTRVDRKMQQGVTSLLSLFFTLQMQIPRNLSGKRNKKIFNLRWNMKFAQCPHRQLFHHWKLKFCHLFKISTLYKQILNVDSTDSQCFMLPKYLLWAFAFALFWACTCT